MRTSQQKNDFWNWSLKVYKNPKTKAACLHLQDEFSLDVNTLLWLCWLASDNHAPTPKALEICADISQKWNHKLTKNVRNARKTVGDLHLDTTSHLKSEFLKLELMFERRQQSELENISEKVKSSQPISKIDLCQQNLNMYLDTQSLSSVESTNATQGLCRSIFRLNSPK